MKKILLSLLFLMSLTTNGLASNDLISKILIKVDGKEDVYQTTKADLYNKKIYLNYKIINKKTNEVINNIVLKQLDKNLYMYLLIDKQPYHLKDNVGFGLFLTGVASTIEDDRIEVKSNLIINNTDIIESESDGTNYLFNINNIDGTKIVLNNILHKDSEETIFEDEEIKITLLVKNLTSFSEK